MGNRRVLLAAVVGFSVAVGAVSFTQYVSPVSGSFFLGSTSDGTDITTVEVVDADVSVSSQTYPVFGPDHNRVGEVEYRVVEGTGNCCENYVSVTPGGRIVDVGGSYPHFSDDRGRTWKRLEITAPIINGEGAVVTAPNGDILAVTWDLYSADRLVSFKYDSSRDEWDYAERSLQTPFSDRPWLSVVPGPVHEDGETYPYATYLKAGYPSKEVGYISYDGLHYEEPSSPSAESLTGTSTLPRQDPGPENWLQPQTKAAIIPTQNGAIAHQSLSDCDWQIADSELSWSCLDMPGLDNGRILLDRQGRVHNMKVDGNDVTYRIRRDSDSGWQRRQWSLPSRYSVESWDWKASGKFNATIVALHTHNQETDKDQDMVLYWDTSSGIEMERRYNLGEGDLNAGGDAGSVDEERFDFTTLSFLPDGSFVASFTDEDHHPPSLAILKQ